MKSVKIIFAVLIFSFVASCKKDSEKGSPSVPFVFKALFSNGDSLIIKEGLNGVNSYGRAGGVIDTLGNYFEIQSTIFTQGGRKASLLFMQTFPSQPDSGEIERIIHTGSYPYGSSALDSLKDGAEITLTDTSGKKWSSAFGIQTASTFSISEHKENDFDIFTPFITTGNFQCTLYDSLGNSLAITSGSFTGRTIVYL
ncbi:MAG: hypothetical protein SH857_09070 [Chitinophagales bacterium]|nr:hypothetical protein [Chitinophagales bacterium]